jgi:hypothetical protein
LKIQKSNIWYIQEKGINKSKARILIFLVFFFLLKNLIEENFVNLPVDASWLDPYMVEEKYKPWLFLLELSLL